MLQSLRGYRIGGAAKYPANLLIRSGAQQFRFGFCPGPNLAAERATTERSSPHRYAKHCAVQFAGNDFIGRDAEEGLFFRRPKIPRRDWIRNTEFFPTRFDRDIRTVETARHFLVWSGAKELLFLRRPHSDLGSKYRDAEHEPFIFY